MARTTWFRPVRRRDAPVVPSASMLVSYIIRLAPEALAEGRVAGEVQVVATGARHPVRNGEELVAMLLAAAREEGNR